MDRILLAKYPAEEYLCQLAALDHASNSDGLTAAYLDRFLDVVALDAAEAIGVRWGADRTAPLVGPAQVAPRAIRLVLVPPAPVARPSPDLRPTRRA